PRLLLSVRHAGLRLGLPSAVQSGPRVPGRLHANPLIDYDRRMSSGVAFFTVCFPSVFSIVDPLSSVPIYLALVGSEEKKEQRRTAARATLTATVVLCLFAAAGTMIFNFFGITIPAFKIAGGILLFTMSLEMMRAKPSAVKNTPEETTEAQQKDDVAIIPI